MTMDEENWTYWAHLPGFVASGHLEQVFGGGRLLSLTHDEWHELDQTVWQPVDYSDSKPMFYRGDLRGGHRTEYFRIDAKLYKDISSKITNVHRALTLAFGGWPLPPTPQLSCTYIKSERDERCFTFIIGAGGRDSILSSQFRQPRNELDPIRLREADLIVTNLERIQDAIAGQYGEATLKAIDFATIPDVYDGLENYSIDLAFVNLVAALENIVVPVPSAIANNSITKIFAQNISALCAEEFANINELSEVVRKVYQLRSDLMHSRRGVNPREDEQLRLIAVGWVTILEAVRRIIALWSVLGVDVDLPTLLSGAMQNRSNFDGLAKALTKGGVR
jgi:hypothetical protein